MTANECKAWTVYSMIIAAGLCVYVPKALGYPFVSEIILMLIIGAVVGLATSCFAYSFLCKRSWRYNLREDSEKRAIVLGILVFLYISFPHLYMSSNLRDLEGRFQSDTRYTLDQIVEQRDKRLTKYGFVGVGWWIKSRYDSSCGYEMIYFYEPIGTDYLNRFRKYLCS